MEATDPSLAPLNATSKQQAQVILRAYGDFWTNVAFQKGWAKPVFRYVDVQPQLEKAAELVVRIRNRLDAVNKDPSTKFHRLAEGSVREYLWSVTKKPSTKEEAEEFLRGVVHANFCDASGYVEGLSKETVDELIDNITKALSEEEEKLKKETQLEDKLAQAWEETGGKIKELLQHKDTEILAKLADVRAGHLSKILELLAGIDQELNAVLGAKRRETELKRSAAPAEPEEKPEPAAPAEAGEKAAPPSEAAPAETAQDEEENIYLQVKQVAEQVSAIGGEIKDLVRQTDTLREAELALNPEAAAKEVEDLQYKCMKYANLLMNDLLTLDNLVGSQKARPLKKEQVLHIQGMLDDVDTMKKKLMDLKHHIPVTAPEQPEKEAKGEEEKPQEPPKEETAAQPEEPAKPTEEPAKAEPTPMEQEGESKKRTASAIQLAGSPLSKQWRSMKLKPRMQVAEHPDCFVISSYVPQMKKEDISINCAADTITISGVREPTQKEESTMRNTLKDRFRALTGKEFDYVCLDEDEDNFLLQMGAGRFGRFQETYKVPPYVDLDNVKSLYQGGRLVVILPFKKEYSAPQLRTRAPAERGGVTNPFVGGHFMEDQDFWW